MYHGQPGFIRYVPWNLALKLGGFMVHIYIYIYRLYSHSYHRYIVPVLHLYIAAYPIFLTPVYIYH